MAFHQDVRITNCYSVTDGFIQSTTCTSRFFFSLSFKLGLLPLALDRDGISTNIQVHNPDKISSLVKD